MTAQKKISLNFRRMPGHVVAGIVDATLGTAASKPFNPQAEWRMPDTLPELKREIHRITAFVNDRDYKMRMVEKAERVEALTKHGQVITDEIEAVKKKFTFGGILGRRKEISTLEEEFKQVDADREKLKAEEEKMRHARDFAGGLLEKMDAQLRLLEGRPAKPKKTKAFTL